jgi:WD40 repeat protein
MADALGGDSDVPDHSLLGTIGGFDLLEVIARGGMGIVYRARQSKPQREVALKALSGGDLLEGDARERFRIELDATASLDHPAILPVYESGEESGVPFFTMKLASGGTLAGRIGSYAGKWEEIASLMLWVAEAVHFAHQQGVIHRDIKPGNILFDESGKAYVSDFGLAKLLGRQSDLTRSIAMLGTPHYLAPEVAAKNAAAASPASDIWALGAVLFELLAGHPPFAADSVPSLLRSIVEDEPKSLPPEVPRPLRNIALKALNKDPARRYSSAACLADDLGRWLRGDAVLARPTHLFERLWIKSRKRPRVIVISFIALISLCGVVWLEIHRRAENVRLLAIERAMREESRARWLDQARAGRVEKLVGWRESGLEALRKAAAVRPDADLRDEAINYLAGFDLKEIPLPGGLPADDRNLSDSSIRLADSGWDAATDREAVKTGSGIVVRQRSDQKVVAEFPDLGLDDTYAIILGPGGRMVLVITTTFRLILLDTQSAQTVGSWEYGGISDATVGGDIMFLITSPAGEQPSAEGPFEFFGVSMRDGRRFPSKTVFDDDVNVAKASQSADQPFIALAGKDSLKIWNWKTGEQRLSRPLTAPILKLEWIAGRFVSRDKGGAVAVYDPLQKRHLDVQIGNRKVLDFVITADARALLLRDEGNFATVIQLDSLEPLVRMARTGPKGPWIDLRRTPPEVVENASQGHRFHQLVRPDVLRSISWTSLGFSVSARAHFSPDGRWLLLTTEQELRIVDHVAGKVLLTMPLEDAFCAFFSHDSKHLIVCEERKISLHELVVENQQLKARHVRDLKQVEEKFSSYPSLSYNRRWLSVPESAERMLVLDCGDFETWQSFPAAGAANVTWPSGDGRWLVAGSSGSSGLRLWDRKAGGEARMLREGQSAPKFSPDDRWLVEKDKDNAHITVYDTTDWKAVFKTRPVDEEWPGSIDWSPDGRLLAVSMASNKVRLIEAGTWRTVANLEGSTQDVGQVLFSPCGGHLVETSETLIDIWDLVSMREKLAALGMPVAFPPPAAAPAQPPEFGDALLPVE